ncbi:aminodeoxychorismate synthase component I [Oscillospiraceae bacterium CM]|nr:aminodeoxychorismate synthase component I [Oscillospiraceae bacterium CM]
MKIVVKELMTSLDAFDIYSLYKDEKDIIFLDSSLKNEYGRYSILGLNPFAVLKGRHRQCELNGKAFDGDVFDELSRLLRAYHIEHDTDLPIAGGCLGYFSYDLGLDLEEIKTTSQEDVVLPHFYFVFYDNLIVFDHAQSRTFVTACGRLRDAHDSIGAIETAVSAASPVVYHDRQQAPAPFISSLTKPAYLAAIRRMIDYILAGDIYIANLTQRLYCETTRETYDIYRDLRKANPAPFAALMRLDGFDVISSSPERFLKIRDNCVETRPIKGTRPRGATPAEDEKNKAALAASEKDKAELLMIVDLERNDLSKVCQAHSVAVTELYKIEAYSTVFHLVSTITGRLKDGVDAVHGMQACFPGGSITGTPKIRAMEIIDELEGLKRALYTGCIGYFSFDGNADFNIVIRTILKKGSDAYLGVGGGITCDSDPEAEYQECLDKAKALLNVL